jgi:hypothetical protein
MQNIPKNMAQKYLFASEDDDDDDDDDINQIKVPI